MLIRQATAATAAITLFTAGCGETRHGANHRASLINSSLAQLDATTRRLLIAFLIGGLAASPAALGQHLGQSTTTVSTRGELSSSAAPGDLDAAFGTGGYLTTDFSFDAVVDAGAALDADGRILVRATVSSDDLAGVILARYQADGAIDPTFGTDGTVFDETFSLGGALQSNGNIIVAACCVDAPAVGRYLPDGEFDTSFGTNGKTVIDFEESFFGVRARAQRDDRILVLAWTGENRPTGLEIARLNADGSSDTSFGTDGLVKVDFGGSTFGVDLLELPDGKILVIGRRPSVDGFVRLNPDGTPDASFGADGLVEVEMPFAPSAATLQADGEIIVAGVSNDVDNVALEFVVARYRSDGRLDEAFGTDGIVRTPTPDNFGHVFDLTVQDDGKIVLGGFATFSDLAYRDVALVRYHPDGSLDVEFGDDGVWTWDIAGNDDAARELIMDPQDHLIVAGTAGTDFFLSRHIMGAGSDTDAERNEAPDSRVVLHQNFPNPVSASTAIEFELPAPAATALVVYDVLGREVVTLVSRHLPAGRHAISWHPNGAAAGVYTYRLRTEDVVTTRQMLAVP